MNKTELLNLIDQTIQSGTVKITNSHSPSVYQIAVGYLNKMKKVLVSDNKPNSSQAESTSLDLFVSRELEPIDSEYASELSKVTYNYDKYFDLLDPDIEALMG